VRRTAAEVEVVVRGFLMGRVLVQHVGGAEQVNRTVPDLMMVMILMIRNGFMTSR
jgi:hypothetical protein